MAMKSKPFYEFGAFRLDPEEASLRRDGRPVPLKPKVFETLLVLVENRGRLLDKETLMRRLWQDTYVEEANLAVNVSQLRKALGQAEGGTQFIETVPRRGYRFVADVQEVWPEEAAIVINEYTSARITIEEAEGTGGPVKEVRRQARPPARVRPAVIAAALALILAAAGLWLYWQAYNLRQAREAVARVEEMVREERYFDAYNLAISAKPHLSDDPALARLLPMITDELSVVTEPAGAQVYLKRVNQGEPGRAQPRQLAGTTPVTGLKVARGDYILEVEKEGYAPVRRIVSSALGRVERSILGPAELRREVRMVETGSGALTILFDADAPIQIQAKLVAAAEAPERMVLVPGGDYRLVSYGKLTAATVRLDDYFIDRFEVTNAEYREFIAAGGYWRREFWKQPFRKDGRELSWEETMRQFKDRTGLDGPRSWSNQDFPEGKGQHPVTDVTWYEAAAYAEFRGKQLPTVFQWEKAARDGAYTHTHGFLMPWGLKRANERLSDRANFLGSGTVPVDSLESGMSPYGCYHMAGNVAEWCRNPQPSGFTTAGGSWQGPFYIFANFGTHDPFYSAGGTGFRCVITSPRAAGDQGAMTLEPGEEVPAYRPTSAAEAQSMLRHYQYDRTSLDSQVVEVEEKEAWRREKISYAGAGGERAFAYLYLPKNTRLPVPAIHYVPTDSAYYGLTVPEEVEAHAAPYIKAGRALFAVVLKGYKERPWPANHRAPKRDSVAYREMVVNWAVDHRRGLDYLATRTEVDSGKIAGFAVSVNNRKLALIAAEPRYAAVILLGAGLLRSWAGMIAEADGANFAPHIDAPKLMIHGRYDEAIPYKTEGEPLYRLLREPKRMILFDQGHVPSLELTVPAINTWLDETLGPVRRE